MKVPIIFSGQILAILRNLIDGIDPFTLAAKPTIFWKVKSFKFSLGYSNANRLIFENWVFFDRLLGSEFQFFLDQGLYLGGK